MEIPDSKDMEAPATVATETSAKAGDASAQPEAPSAQVAAPAADAEKPAAQTEEPLAQTEEPSATVEEPPAQTKKPSATVEAPAAHTEEPAATTDAESAADISAQIPEQAQAASDSQDKAPAQPKPAAAINVAEELDKLVTELESIGHKATAKLVTVDNLLNRYRKLIAEEEQDLLARATAIRESLTSRFAENARHQLSLQKATDELLDKLEKALAEGQSLDALPTWDRIQGNISNTNGEIRQSLQARANPFKAKILELRDWKIFAATEKKKELIQQMEQLCESTMHAGDRSKHITRLHMEWKELGRSNQNEELWQQFKLHSDRAYEPCAEYFKERKQQMAANLKARRELCDHLDQQVKGLNEGEGEIKVSDFNKLIKDAEDTWKKHAPVEQSRIRSLQKRFYDNINVLRKQRKSILKTNANAKRALIEQANALVEMEDRSQAIEEAKRLQKEWKEIGPTSFKEDREHWENFRAACDKLFDSRNKEKQQRTTRRQTSEKEIQDKLGALEKIFDLAEDELQKARAEYQDLAQGFSSALDALDRARRSRFLDRFNAIKRKIDNRLKALPDKKSLALMEQLQASLDYLQQIETGLLAAGADAFDSAKQKFSMDAWQALDKVKSDSLLSLLQRRAGAVQDSATADDYAKRVADATEAARELCIQVEIRAGNDSPETDQGKRMEIQLAQLQKGLGQARHTSRENLQFMQEARLQLLCLGPLAEADRQAFRQRLEDSSKRLL